MKISPKIGSIVVALVVGSFFAFVSYEGDNKAKRSLYAAFVGVTLGMTVGYSILKNLDEKSNRELFRQYLNNFLPRLYVVLVGVICYFVAENIYHDSVKAWYYAFIGAAIFAVLYFLFREHE